MNKKIVILGVCIVFIGISCGYLRDHKLHEVHALENSKHVANNEVVSKPTSASHDEGEPRKTVETVPILADPDPEKPITQYDSKKLDDEVRAEALKMNKDPASYRKIVRIERDGTQICRQIGMHVIVFPNKEEVFLPDEI